MKAEKELHDGCNKQPSNEVLEAEYGAKSIGGKNMVQNRLEAEYDAKSIGGRI